MDISVVIPVYGCRACLEELHRRLVASLGAISPSFEIILVNDACPQNSWEVIKQIALKDTRVKGLDLSRNFGQIRAITAGLHYAEGDWIVVMDCDLQDRPEEITRLYNKAQEGYDVVFSRRAVRKDTFLKKLSSRVFYAIYSYFTAGVFDSTICNYSISRRMVMDAYKRIGDQKRAFILFIKWMGFKSTAIDIDHGERSSGKSSYTIKKELGLVGLSAALVAALYALFTVVRYFVQGISVSGWTSLIVSIYFVGGLILAQLGILGLYIGYVFDQTKARPLYIVREVVENQKLRLGGK